MDIHHLYRIGGVVVCGVICGATNPLPRPPQPHRHRSALSEARAGTMKAAARHLLQLSHLSRQPGVADPVPRWSDPMLPVGDVRRPWACVVVDSSQMAVGGRGGGREGIPGRRGHRSKVRI
ncbi:hypothetical protein SETIT_3G006900v2 [Setaria italica]|uniref:Uncharacterized protein n=1 Tax=Setaria italica TaxID=4555 RepID=A0A368QAF0_SETIT|nr:hypothetical protein SETIT_3G006900v2 [Setaria italica]